MRTVKDVEAYLESLNQPLSPVEGSPGTYLLRSSPSMPPIAVRVEDPLVVFRVHIGPIAGPASSRTGESSLAAEARLLRRLLTFNSSELVHASYGLEDGEIVLSAALELENLDLNEVEAVLDELDVALARQVPELSELSKRKD